MSWVLFTLSRFVISRFECTTYKTSVYFPGKYWIKSIFTIIIIIFVFSLLDCSGQQVAVDLWTFGSSYVDLATLSGISKFSGGQVQHFPGYHVVHNTPMAAKFESALRRYFTRKIGFEAVMRIRCTRGLALHTFHGNFFVRSTDLLSLPNINPDAGFGMQVSGGFSVG